MKYLLELEGRNELRGSQVRILLIKVLRAAGFKIDKVEVTEFMKVRIGSAHT